MRIGLIDIETSPNTAHVWGLFGQNISIKQLIDSSYTMCHAWKWLGKKGVEYRSIHKHSEEEMLSHAWNKLDQADAVIHYNGSKFDIPTLQKEFLQHGMGPPSPFHQIDLFKVVRKEFRFPSKKLDYVAQALGVGSKIKHEGHELWVACMEGDPSAWKRMERYNKQDTMLLENLYHRLLPWIKNHPNHALYLDTDRPVCTNCGSEHVQSRGTVKSKTQIYRRFCCNDCGTWQRSRQNSTPNKEHVLTQA